MFASARGYTRGKVLSPLLNFRFSDKPSPRLDTSDTSDTQTRQGSAHISALFMMETLSVFMLDTSLSANVSLKREKKLKLA